MSTTPVLNAQGQLVRSALKTEEDVNRTPPGGPTKAVQIAEPEPTVAEESLHLRKQFAASVSGRRLSGRPPISTGASSRSSVYSQSSLDNFDLNAYSENASPMPQSIDESSTQVGQQQPQSHRHKIDRASEKLLAQVADWIHREKSKRETRKPRKHHHHHLRGKSSKSPAREDEEAVKAKEANAAESEEGLHRVTSVESNESEVSLDRLQRILDNSLASLGLNSIPHYTPKVGRRLSHRHRRNSTRSLLNRGASSDTDYVDGDVLVPSCDTILDNTKTLKYSKGNADDTASISARREEKEKKAWVTFKNEIIRLAHTLRLKGWRRVALDSGDHISVERLSGALTNAVYVVTPPMELLAASSSTDISKKPPPKLLLRIYGPQVEHLIDRDNELSILKRLARKKIGPRMLGTFTNGRFEQFFNAAPLTPEEMRQPETSKQIAKRMRELHDGIALLEEEKDEGPFVFRNWDSWVDNVERRTVFLDKQILSLDPDEPLGLKDAWKARGFICGVEWHKFKAVVDKYREFLVQCYGGPAGLREKLVFAHNDTQYGNILRVRPDDEKSPLLQPENQHKQLIVIDFEYASANTPGLEFANHFTEWAYNYHDERAAHACITERYPTLEQQERFIKAYIAHRPKFPYAGDSTPNTPLATPSAPPQLQSTNSSSSIVEFMLDARVPPGGWKEEETKEQKQNDERAEELMKETRLWRAMNSAQWVAWGIVQAKIPGMIEACDGEQQASSPSSAAEESHNTDKDDDDSGFDYLAYAYERALFFWGDCVQMGLVKLEELPEGLRSKIKFVEY